MRQYRVHTDLPVLQRNQTPTNGGRMMEQMTEDEWIKKGTELYGERMSHWVFKCPSCPTMWDATAVRDAKRSVKLNEMRKCNGQLHHGGRTAMRNRTGMSSERSFQLGLSDSMVTLFKIFYAWQSDLPNATNRGFIEDALDLAMKELRSSPPPSSSVTSSC